MGRHQVTLLLGDPIEIGNTASAGYCKNESKRVQLKRSTQADKKSDDLSL